MSGSNQAQPLQGLLGSLTGAFNKEDMGQGLMFAQNIRDYNAPVLDANDPNSLMDRQRWAQMNGYQKEAVAMGSALGKLNAANQLKEENAAKATNVANMFGNMIPSLPEGRQDEARSVRDALANEQITYKDALDWLDETRTGGVDPTGTWVNAQLYADDYNATRGLKPGDEGFMSVSEAYDRTAKVTRDVGNAKDVAFSTAEGKALGEQGVEDTTNILQARRDAENTNNLYREAIKLVDEGAGTGAIESKLPTIRAASKELENIGNQLGFAIVAGGKFGQLTEKELALALETGLPVGLDGPELKDWLERKIAANEKLIAEYQRYVNWAKSPQNNSQDKTAAYYEVNILGRDGSAVAEDAPATDPVTGKQSESTGVLRSDGNTEEDNKLSDDDLLSKYGNVGAS